MGAEGEQYIGLVCSHAGRSCPIHTSLPRCDPVGLTMCAAAGLTGLMDPVEPGLACGSDTAHLSLFGYDPRTYYRGRGAFESMGAGRCCSAEAHGCMPRVPVAGVSPSQQHARLACGRLHACASLPLGVG